MGGSRIWAYVLVEWCAASLDSCFVIFGDDVMCRNVRGQPLTPLRQDDWRRKLASRAVTCRGLRGHYALRRDEERLIVTDEE